MDIKHRISINTIKDAEFMTAVIELGIDHEAIELPGGSSKLVTFVIVESDPRWETVAKLIKSYKDYETYGPGDQFETVFSEYEIRNASWLRLKSTFEQGILNRNPTGRSNNSVMRSFAQNVPSIDKPIQCDWRKSLVWEENRSCRLIWTGEIFCTPEVILSLEDIQAKGYEIWDAIIHKTGQLSERIRQLYVPGIALPGVIIDDDLERKICSVCGTSKYYPHVKGPMYLKEKLCSQIPISC